MVTAFFAYPSEPRYQAEALRDAANKACGPDLTVETWESDKALGLKIDDNLEKNIETADFLIADITIPNFNVFYEIGFAIAKSKPVFLAINAANVHAKERIMQIGLFDMISYYTYQNSDELSEGIRYWQRHNWTGRYERSKDHSSPLFVVDTVLKTDFRNHIYHAIQNYKIRFKSYDPTEMSRLTAAQAISFISSCSGFIAPLLATDHEGHYIHNLVVAFLAGLSCGYGIEPLLIQLDNRPAPIDYRRHVKNSQSRRETERHVEDYCQQTLLLNQEPATVRHTVRAGLLGKVSLGASSAENEAQSLVEYFVETSEFARASRAEASVIIGRKGSGKSAIFFRLRDNFSKDRRNLVVDLRPASHQLSLMREHLINKTNVGIFQHTIASFWHYVIYFEILLALREAVLPKAKNDILLQRRLIDLEERFGLNDAIVAGDFTSRLESKVQEVIAILNSEGNLNSDRSKITNQMFISAIPDLRDQVFSLMERFEEAIVLIDDLDKGWPPRQVAEHDVMTIRHLVESMRKIQSEMRGFGHTFKHFIFLRGDIYEQLVESTSDRGKYNVIRVDWTDPLQLRHMLKQRVAASVEDFEVNAAWSAIDTLVLDGDGANAVDIMIRSSLRRPRFLIDLCERVISSAVNRGHHVVTNDDLEEGLKQMAMYLVSDFGYEMRDVSGISQDVLYSFIGCSDLLTIDEIGSFIVKAGFDGPVTIAVDILLWYGFLGVVTRNGSVLYVYDVAYDFRRLLGERDLDAAEQLYSINPAFLRGLIH